MPLSLARYFPEKVEHTHHTFSDPAKASGAEEEILNSFRKTRDEIESFCFKLYKGNLLK